MQQENPAVYCAAGDYDERLVAVDHRAVQALKAEMASKPLPAFMEPTSHPSEVQTVAFELVMGALNFMFWDAPSTQSWPYARAELPVQRYSRNGAVGAWAMTAAMDEWWQDAARRTGALDDLSMLKTMAEDLQTRPVTDFLGDIPLPAQRVAILQECLNPLRIRALCEGVLARVRYEGRLDWRDAQWIAALLPMGYSDPYLKKAQLTLMQSAAKLRPYGHRITLDVTLAADYQLPKVLRHLGVLHYSDEIAQAVECGQLFDEDSSQERAIRAATVLAGEALKGDDGPVEALDNWLWQMRNDVRDAPFHLCKTTRY